MSGIYIHIPFCKQKCSYCNFHFSTQLMNKSLLIDALVSELIQRKEELQDIQIDTIYFGGGTPSLLSIEEINRILDTITKNFQAHSVQEITLEANPDDLTLSYLQDLKANTTINRLSIGVQSFFQEDLDLMNRAHDSNQAEKCIQNAQVIGFDNITIDLIYGAQTTSDERWIQNLDKAIQLNIPHISSYALTVEPKTALKHNIEKKKLNPIDEETQLRHFNILTNKLKNAGYIQYEFSNFGKPNFFSKHNQSYWKGKAYLGIGPSAHSFNGENTRRWNIANNAKYISLMNQNETYWEEEFISETDKYNEMIMLGLRTISGVNAKHIEDNFNSILVSHFEKELGILLRDNKVIVEDKKITIAPEYIFQTDGIISDLFYIE